MRALIESLQQDIRYTLRGLRRTPGFTATVMVTLGLGIGANAAMFSVTDRLMFRSFPYLRDPTQVQRVYLQTTSRGRTITSHAFPYTRYLDLRGTTSSFSNSTSIAEWRLAIGQGDGAHEVQTAGVDASFFGFFDARPAVGRFFTAAEDGLPRGADVSVISYGLWQSEFGGRNVLGQRLQVGPLLTTIVGVAPQGFIGVSEGEPADVFMPITTYVYGLNQGDAASFATKYRWDVVGAIVRRKPGVTIEAATADLTNAFIQSRDKQHLTVSTVVPANIAHPRAIAGALRAAAGPDAGLESSTLLWVSGVALIVLLIAGASVANLMLARVLRRRREIAVRLALGVSRSRLSRQFLVEGLILATLGSVAGLIIAQWVAAGLRRLLDIQAQSSPLLTDWPTIAIAVVLALVVGALISAGPAALVVRGDLAPALRAGAREGTYQRSRLRSGLLVLQGALSVVLLVGAGLFVRSLHNVRSMRLGWEPEPVLVVTPNLRGLQLDSAALTAYRQHLLETVQSVPGVTHSARVNSMPFATSTMPLFVEGIDSVARLGRFNYQASSNDYFATVGTRILRGRAYNAQDRGEASRVAVVSESMGKRLWPGRDPIGQCFRVNADTTPCVRVIGVAEDAVQYDINDSERLLYYIPDEHSVIIRPANRILVRMAGDAASQIGAIERAMQAAMIAPSYVTVAPLEGVVDKQRRSWRLGATMFVAFGGLALIVAAVGLYGIIAYGVAQRMHELGVRIALGAGSRDIVRLVVSQAVAFVTAGVAIGAGVALLVGRWVQPLLFHESATDPLVYTGVGVVLAVVAFAASAAPALRATRADPNVALRAD